MTHPLKRYLEAQGIRPAAWARRIGVSATTVSNWLRARTHPSIHYALDCELEAVGGVRAMEILAWHVEKMRAERAAAQDEAGVLEADSETLEGEAA